MPGSVDFRPRSSALIALLTGVIFVSAAAADPLNGPGSLQNETAPGLSSATARAQPVVSSRRQQVARLEPQAALPKPQALPQPQALPLSLPQLQPQKMPLSGRTPTTNTGCLPASLQQALADVQAKFGPVEVVSTHRPGARIAGTGHRSMHASCEAVDFRPARGTYGAVASYLRGSWRGGVGTYSSGHIHIDTGANYHWHHGVARGQVRGERRG
jgi:uncharacterized protein YcbK (DUF882 family)